MLVERKSKQTAIDDRPEPMSSPINNPVYSRCEVILTFEVKKERGVTLQVQKVLKCGIITLNKNSFRKRRFKQALCLYTGNLDFTGFLGLEKYL